MNILIGLHAGLGEIGALASLWVLVEILNASESSLRRARTAALIAVLFLAGSWFFGGYNYLTNYTEIVKPIIKNGPLPWAHSVITETKEHVFLFLPFLAVLELSLLTKFSKEILVDSNIKKAATYTAILTVLLFLAMVGMGVFISSGFRVALEALQS